MSTIRSTRRPARPRRGRGGISLVEVLISIGVLAIGLLGVAALLPLAHHEARQGVLEDRKAAAGQRAYREFKIRGMANPENWVGDVSEPNTGVLRRAPYCLDPLGVAAVGSNTWFPFAPVTRPIPAMRRITLSARPGQGTLGALRNGSTPVPMSALQAGEVFRVQDDLVFNTPEDTQDLVPPQQSWLPNSLNRFKRVAEGRFTWFATLVPEPMVDNDLYRLSLVVTAERLPQADVAAEQVARVQFLGAEDGTSGGNLDVAYAGGDVALVSDQPINGRQGQWLLLGQSLPNNQADFRWYRIVAADSSEGQATREFTLQGPDWRLRSSSTWATLVPNVEAVFEKTVRLESSSLWTSY